MAISWELWGTVLFYLAIFLIVYFNRKKFEFQAKIMALYKTRIGLRLMDWTAEKLNRLVKTYGYISIVVGFMGIPVILFILVLNVAVILKEKFFYDGSPLILPGVPIAGTGGVRFPLIIGWVSLFIIMIVHEFSHGVVARAHKVRVKSTGIMFMGPLLGAFVEPDDKELAKTKPMVRYSVLGAGPFSNFILFIVVALASAYLLFPAIMSASEITGLTATVAPNSSAADAGLTGDVLITGINGQEIVNYTTLIDNLEGKKPGDVIAISTDSGQFEIILSKHPDNESQGYIGITQIMEKREPVDPSAFGWVKFKAMLWLDELFFWTSLISLMVGLINLFPVFMTDGAQMMKVACDQFIRDKKKAQRVWLAINKSALIIILIVLLLPFYFNIQNWLFG